MADFEKILLIDDHPLFRNGLKSLVNDAFPRSEIREAGSLAEARNLLSVAEQDIIVLDVTLPDGDGISLARELLAETPDCRIYILTMHRRTGLLVQAREAGCRGYFLKEGDGGALIDALKTDDIQFSVSLQLKDLLASSMRESDTSTMYANLTRREKEIFKLFAEGLGYKEVAWNLSISPRTASVHRYNIFQKLNISSDVEMVKVAQEVGLSI
jgi:DNA-binding NarL/FixJ family response regulator